MNATDLALKIQAHLDGELPRAESAEVERLLQADPEAHALFAELSQTRLALQAGEPAPVVPDSREFYWSKIARALKREERSAQPQTRRVSPWWMRLAASFAGCAALILVALNINRFGNPATSTPPSFPIAGIVESALDDTATITFRSEAEGLTVVWVSTD